MRLRALLGLTLIVLLAAAAVLLPVKDWLRAALTWTAQHRETSWCVFLALYVVAAVCLVPGLILTLAAGAIFGVPAGIALVSVGSVAGATAAFFVGRTFAREWISRRIETWPRFRALDHALRERGLWIVLLTRMSPAFPFNLLNYAYGVTAVRPRDYIIGSWVGMLPATVLYVYAGSAAANVSQAVAGPVRTGTSGVAFVCLGLAATLAVTVLVTRRARRELDRELAA